MCEFNKEFQMVNNKLLILFVVCISNLLMLIVVSTALPQEPSEYIQWSESDLYDVSTGEYIQWSESDLYDVSTGLAYGLKGHEDISLIQSGVEILRWENPLTDPILVIFPESLNEAGVEIQYSYTNRIIYNGDGERVNDSESTIFNGESIIGDVQSKLLDIKKILVQHTEVIAAIRAGIEAHQGVKRKVGTITTSISFENEDVGKLWILFTAQITEDFRTYTAGYLFELKPGARRVTTRTKSLKELRERRRELRNELKAVRAEINCRKLGLIK
jgi:hypothetical protein